MSKNVSRAAGFTIIELLVTVTIVGILASVAIPTFVRYQKKSRTVEMYEGLSKVATGAKIYYTKHAQLPKGAPDPNDKTAMSPAMSHTVRCDQGHHRFPEASLMNFDKPEWTDLLFRPSDRTLYRYSFVDDSDTSASPPVIRGVAHAEGDLDCDGEYSRFEIRLQREGGVGGPLLQQGTFCVIGSETE